MKRQPLDVQLVRRFLQNESDAAEDIIDRVPVFSGRYNRAVDRLEEVKDVLEALDRIA